jgi:hypothetical protein
MADMLGRIILATAAVALVAVTALELRAELDYQHGQDLFSEVSQQGFAADATDEIERARDSLDRASDLRPGTNALVAQAFLEKSAGHPEVAAALARQATHREPENVATWQALLSTSRDADERARSQQELLLLDPLHGQR